jgi:hypothetical protein
MSNTKAGPMKVQFRQAYLWYILYAAVGFSLLFQINDWSWKETVAEKGFSHNIFEILMGFEKLSRYLLLYY